MASLRRLLGSLVMALVTLVVAHDLVFLLAYGSEYDAALARSGHDGAWGSAVAVVLLAAVCLIGVGSWRLYRLGVIVRSLEPSEGPLAPSVRDFARSLLDLWWRLAVAAIVLFVLEENVEHLHVGSTLPGLSVLSSPAYPNAAWIIAGIALLVAFVGSIFRWRRARLLALIATLARTTPAARPRRTPSRRGSRPAAGLTRRTRLRGPGAAAARSLTGGSTPRPPVA